MAAITNYSTLAAAIDTWDERTHDSDEIIGLAEGSIRLMLGPHFAKEASVTVAFTAGSAALPAGYIRPLSLTHATYGELTQMAVGEVRKRRIWDTSGVPGIYAVTGSTVEVAPIYTGNLTFDIEGTLTGLSGSNATNWLITNAPQVYLSMCMSVAKAKFEDFAGAATYQANAQGQLDELAMQAVVGAQGRASVAIPGATP
jgi:hypothetical protein